MASLPTLSSLIPRPSPIFPLPPLFHAARDNKLDKDLGTRLYHIYIIMIILCCIAYRKSPSSSFYSGTVSVYCNNGDLRLAGSSVPAQGRVELCWNETWGTICDELWSISDANVACRQLGYAASGMKHTKV